MIDEMLALSHKKPGIDCKIAVELFFDTLFSYEASNPEVMIQRAKENLTKYIREKDYFY